MEEVGVHGEGPYIQEEIQIPCKKKKTTNSQNSNQKPSNCEATVLQQQQSSNKMNYFIRDYSLIRG